MRTLPKFSVGETVAVYGVFTNQYDTDSTIVTDVNYFEEGIMQNDVGAKSESGWRYKTAHQPDKSRWWREESLVKAATPKISFCQLMRELNCDTV